MAKEPSTRRAARDREVTDRAIHAVVVAVLADRAGRTYPLPKGRHRDITATIRQNTRAAVARAAHKPARKRNMVRTAILLGHPI